MDSLETAGISNIRQKLPRSKKTQEWRENNVDAVINSCKAELNSRRSTSKDKIRNYKILNNEIDKSHFLHVTNPAAASDTLKQSTNHSFQLPATLQPYDVLSPIFFKLFGEETKRYWNPIARVINEEATSQKLKQQKDQYMSLFQEFLLGNVEDEEFKEQASYSIKDLREKYSEQLLTYYSKKLRLSDEFYKGWVDALVAGEEIYRVDSINGEPTTTRVNPLECFFRLPNNSDQVDEATMIYERNKLTIPEIIDEFYHLLTPEQIDLLESNETSFDFQLSGYWSPSTLPSDIPFAEDNYNLRGTRDVHRVRWKSFRKYFIYHYLDPQTNEEQEVEVDESFLFDRTNPNNYISPPLWKNEYWEGIRIGSDMYLQIQPRKQQYRSISNPSKCKSGYIGTVHNCVNARSISLMDRLIPFLYLYLIIMYDTELALATNFGKIGTIDVRLLPDNISIEQCLYYMRSTKLLFIDSHKESNKSQGIPGQGQNQLMKEINLENGAYIQFHLNLLQELERKMYNCAGIPPERMGDISPRQLVGNTEQAIQQSSDVTEPHFRTHNLTKLRVCEALIETAKASLKEKPKAFQYFMDDGVDILFSLTEDSIDADIGLFLGDSQKDMEALNAMKENIKFALQNDKIEFANILDIYQSDSVAVLRNKLRKAFEEKQQIEQQNFEAEQELEHKKADQQQTNFETHENNLIYIADQKTSADIYKADLMALGMEKADPQLIDDTAQLALQQQEIGQKHFLETQKIAHDKGKHQEELKIKNKELEIKEKERLSKEKIEGLKLKLVEKQNANQISLANKKSALDEKMANKKIELEKIKTRAAIQKAKQTTKKSK